MTLVHNCDNILRTCDDVGTYRGVPTGTCPDVHAGTLCTGLLFRRKVPVMTSEQTLSDAGLIRTCDGVGTYPGVHTCGDVHVLMYLLFCRYVPVMM